MKIKILDIKGKEKTEKVLDKEIFEVKSPEILIKEAVIRHLANKRQATSKTKTRAEVSGGGKKPWRQKGTGRARVGSSRNPIWRTGGVVFGPTGNENYSKKMNKKSLRSSIKAALSLKADKKLIKIIENFDIKNPKTKEINKILKAIEIDKRVLLISDENVMLAKAVNNLKNVDFLLFNQLNPYAILVADYIVFTENGFDKAVDFYKKTERISAKKTVKKMTEKEPKNDLASQKTQKSDKGVKK